MQKIINILNKENLQHLATSVSLLPEGYADAITEMINDMEKESVPKRHIHLNVINDVAGLLDGRPNFTPKCHAYFLGAKKKASEGSDLMPMADEWPDESRRQSIR